MINQTEKADNSDVRYIKLLAVSGREKEDLADFIKRIRKEKRRSLAEVARLSGGLVSKPYLSQIENRDVLNPTKDVIFGIAKGLDVDPQVVFSVSIGERPEETQAFKESDFAVLFFKSEELDEEAKQELETVLKWAHARVDEMIREGRIKPRKRP